MAIINNNVENVRFLRNGNLFLSRQAGLDALNVFPITAEMDGTSILARYSGTTTGDSPTTYIKTLVGYVYYKDESNKSITIFDIDDAGADVDEKIKAAIEALDAEITSSDGTNVQVKVTEEDGKITAVNITTDNTVNSGDVDTAITNAINELDGSVIAENGYFVKSVTEVDGKISGTTEALPTVAAISEAGKPITAVSESFGTISATTGTINAEFVNIADSGEKFTATTVEGALAEIATEIDAMDLAVVSGDGEVITAVSEEDGKVSASKTAIKDVKLTGYVKNTAATGAISGTDDIEDALSKLENIIGSNAISNADGSITVTPANGSTTDVKVHIKSGENVIKLDGEGGGIYTNLNLVEITGETLPAETKVRYELRDSDNVKIGESIDIPKDSHIVSINYITGGTHAQNLEYVYVDVSGNTQTTYVDMSALVLEAEFESGVTVDAGSHIVHGVVDPTSETFLTVGSNGFKVAGVQNAIDSAINALDATGGTQTIATGKHVAVEVIEADGKITTVTVVEDNIADADDLAAEITARKAVDGQDGQTYSANTNTNYISGASSLNDADVKLDTALKTADDAMLTGVAAGNGITVSTKENKSQTISAKVKNDGGIVNDADGLHLGYIDAGIYDAQ